MTVRSNTHPDVGGDGAKTGLISATTVDTTAGGATVSWTSGWKKTAAAAAPSLAASLLRRLVIANNDGTESILVALDGTGIFRQVLAGQSVVIENFDTAVSIVLKDGSGTGTEVYLEAHYDEEV